MTHLPPLLLAKEPKENGKKANDGFFLFTAAIAPENQNRPEIEEEINIRIILPLQLT